MPYHEIMKKGTVLRLFSDGIESAVQDHILERTWIIGDVVGTGGSGVCYRAISGDKTGRLKTVDSENAIHSYRLLDRIRMDKPESQTINNHIPVYEILLPLGLTGTCTRYIWTPDDRFGVTFESHIQKQKENNGEDNVKKLYRLLSILLNLTEAVRTFHSIGLLHLDIKPSNVLVSFDWEEDIDSVHTELFDLETVCQVDTQKKVYKVTDGYSAPELYAGHPDYRSDIYSIGACLYTGLMMNKSGESLLINKMDRGIAELVTGEIRKILAKSFEHYPNRRYDSCEDMAEDIKKVKYGLLKYILALY